MPSPADELASIAAREMGRRGGAARASKLSKRRKRQIARMGGAATRAMFKRRKALRTILRKPIGKA